VNEFLIHTGQHYDKEMSDIFFDELGMRYPDENLNVGSASHGEQTAAMLIGIERAIKRERPDGVIVFGDTNSTVAGALAASKLNLPVCHVEAGLRSFNKRMPEEQNRIVTDHLSTLLFAPTGAAARNLEREGVGAQCVHVTGDVMLDATLMFGELAVRRSTVIERLGLKIGEYVVATLHRAANTDDAEVMKACLNGLALASRSMPVVMPMHPRSKGIATSLGLLSDLPATMRIIEPVGYLDMLTLTRSARVIATDSGGLQKEAFFFHVPCVTLRAETEWTELVDAGWNTLCAPGSAKGVAEAVIAATGRVGKDIAPYGQGAAAQQIAELVLHA
jgi:UDP-GlcNAc3NAcA epimerase